MTSLTAEQVRYKRLNQLLQQIFIDRGGNKTESHDFAFHMLDWTEDFDRLKELYANPGRLSRKRSDDVFGFLIHATWHIMEAYRLLNGSECVNPFYPKEKQRKKSKPKRVKQQ